MQRQEGNRRAVPHIAPAGNGPLNLPELREVIGVTSKSLQEWIAGCEDAALRIENAGSAVMKRTFREDVIALRGVIKDIVSNCRHDPDDIREEVGLPSILDRLASTVEEYVTIVSRRNNQPIVLQRLAASEQIIEQATTFLTELLAEMKANDGKDALTRARVLGRIFEVKPSALDSRGESNAFGIRPTN